MTTGFNDNLLIGPFFAANGDGGDPFNEFLMRVILVVLLVAGALILLSK